MLYNRHFYKIDYFFGLNSSIIFAETQRLSIKKYLPSGDTIPQLYAGRFTFSGSIRGYKILA
jgi:hypothetical protein